jgi:hypothetical protein
VALVASLFATMLLACLGMSLVLLGSAGTALAARDRHASAAAQAAEAALRLAVSELRERADWTGVIGPGVADVCAEPGRFVDLTLFPRAPWDGSLLDLHIETGRAQAAADAEAPAGTSAPTWRLFEYGPISRVIPSDARRHPAYVIIWAAGGPGGLVLLRATALGPGSARASLEATIARDGGGTVRRLTIRRVP